MSEINGLVLLFPAGIDVERAQKIAQLAQKISGFNVSEGGFTMLSNPFFDGPMEFSEHEMTYVFKYPRPADSEGKDSL